jgi:hypothetical protein
MDRGSTDKVVLHDPVDVETTLRTGHLKWFQGTWSLAVLKWFGPIYLEIDPDLEQRFEKISNAQDPHPTGKHSRQLETGA